MESMDAVKQTCVRDCIIKTFVSDSAVDAEAVRHGMPRWPNFTMCLQNECRLTDKEVVQVQMEVMEARKSLREEGDRVK